jgi:hypothetical protein
MTPTSVDAPAARYDPFTTQPMLSNGRGHALTPAVASTPRRRMTSTRARTISAAVAAIALTAPAAAQAANGSHPAAQSLEAFLHAVGRADGKTACRYLTTEGKAQFTSGWMPCQRAVAFIYANMTPSERKVLLTSYVTKVTVRGNTATIADKDTRYRQGKPGENMEDEDPGPAVMVKRNGRWLLKDAG